MNYYEHHLGDYAKATGHLTALEHGIYRLLLDWYYANERPIPDALAARYARASRTDVEPILAEFFTLDADVWRHARVDREIDAYRARCEHNRNVGKLGGRPKKPKGNPVGFQTEPEPNPGVTRTEPSPSSHLAIYPEKQDQEHLHGAIAGAIDSAPEVVPPALVMPTVNGSGFPVTPAHVSAWAEAYPGIDVLAELRKARAWLMSNPARGKTARGMTRYCNGWLERAQNEGPRQAPTGAPARSKVRTAYDAIGAVIEEMKNGGSMVPGSNRARGSELPALGLGRPALDGNAPPADHDLD